MRSLLRAGPVRRLLFTQFLLETQFWFPVWLIFLTDAGFTVTVAVLADGVFRVTVVATELPLGVLSDRIGRRSSYLLLCGLSAASYGAIALVHDEVSLFAAWILWGVAWAMSTGLGQAYYFELVRDRAPGADAVGAFGILRVVVSVAVLASHASAGLLYGIDPRLPFVVPAVLALVALAVAWTLPDAAVRSVRASWGTATRELRAQVRRSPDLRGVISLAVALLVVGWTVRIAFQPLLLDLGWGAQASGLMYFAFSAVAILAGAVAGRVAGRLGGARTVGLGFVVLWLAIVGAGIAPSLGPILFVPAIALGYYLADTVLIARVNQLVGDGVRATVLSVVSVAAGVVIAGGRPLVGAIADRASAATAMVVWAVVCIPVVLLALRWTRTLRGWAPRTSEA